MFWVWVVKRGYCSATVFSDHATATMSFPASSVGHFEYFSATIIAAMTSEGYWLPHTSSVNFCEPDYFVSDYIVEFHNTWSSILITVLAIIGYLYGNPTKELRFSVMYFFVAVVGIGSTLLHGTMHWFFQSSDEIPMLWGSLSNLYGLCVMNEDRGSSRSRTYAWIFFTIGMLQTIVYYTFQQFYASFIIVFVTSSACVTTWTAYLAFYEPNAAYRPIRVTLWLSALRYFVIYGAGVWLVDFHMCRTLTPYYQHTAGITLHVLWHAFSSIGAYYIILLLVVVRMQVLKMEPQLEYMAGFIPVCRAQSKVT
jgi:dihydroceramidase